jgi:hypothetical protein
MGQNKSGISRHLSVRWSWVIAWSFAALTFAYGVYGTWQNFTDPPGVDFVSFWAAGRMALMGKAALAYDIHAHQALELTVGRVRGIMSFPYPPPSLLFFAPLSLLPFGVAFSVWVLATCGFYVWAARRLAPFPQSLAIPSTIPNAVIGQNGFLFTGLFIAAAEALPRRPILAGLLFGCFALKPQIGFLIPLALLAGWEWRALLAAACSAALLYVLGLIAFGFASYEAFLNILPHYAKFLSNSGWQWNTLASAFAFLRFFGVPQHVALAAQAVCAAGAAFATWRAWRMRLETRVAVLATASMLISPYLFTYDTVFMVLPFAWLLQNGNRYMAALVWVGCLLPFVSYSGYYTGPNTVPLVAIAALWVLSRQQRASVPAPVGVSIRPAQMEAS